MAKMPRFNEEEIKIKFVLPALRAIGIKALDDLHFEHLIRRPKDGKRGFADILVRRADKTLLVIELKASSINVRSDKAVSQAITYARSHKTVIPLALVCNGRDVAL